MAFASRSSRGRVLQLPFQPAGTLDGGVPASFYWDSLPDLNRKNKPLASGRSWAECEGEMAGSAAATGMASYQCTPQHMGD
jgi:hypothetical protein